MDFGLALTWTSACCQIAVGLPGLALACACVQMTEGWVVCSQGMWAHQRSSGGTSLPVTGAGRQGSSLIALPSPPGTQTRSAEILFKQCSHRHTYTGVCAHCTATCYMYTYAMHMCTRPCCRVRRSIFGLPLIDPYSVPARAWMGFMLAVDLIYTGATREATRLLSSTPQRSSSMKALLFSAL